MMLRQLNIVICHYGKIDLPKGYKSRIIDLLPSAKKALLNQQIHTGHICYAIW